MNAVIYARYSSSSQREESIEGQLRECNVYAERCGLRVIDSYIDRALSAKTDNRPQFQQLMKDSAKELFEVVLVWKLDHFARNRYDSAHNKATLRKNGVKVVSATEPISDDSTGILLESLLEGYAEFYSVELAEKIHRGQTENALKGKSNGRGRSLGYVTDENQMFAIDPKTAPIVQEIFQRYSNGETVADIVRTLNDKGFKTLNGGEFNKNSLHRMLQNRRYIGEYRYRDMVTPDGMPRIIDDDTFTRAQARLEINRKAPAMAKAKVDYLLTTKLFCGKCGAYMVGESGTSKTGKFHSYYKCIHAKRDKICTKKSVRKDEIERLVIQQIQKYVLVDSVLEKLADEIIAHSAVESALLPSLKSELADVNKKISNIVKALEDGVYTSTTKAWLEELETRRDELEISIAREEIARPTLTKEQISFWLSRFKDGDISDFDYCRKLVDIFVNSIYLYDDRVVINLNACEGAEPLSLETIEGSDLDAVEPPPICQAQTTLFSKKCCLGLTGFAANNNLSRRKVPCSYVNLPSREHPNLINQQIHQRVGQRFQRSNSLRYLSQGSVDFALGCLFGLSCGDPVLTFDVSV